MGMLETIKDYLWPEWTTTARAKVRFANYSAWTGGRYQDTEEIVELQQSKMGRKRAVILTMTGTETIQYEYAKHLLAGRGIGIVDD